MKKKYENMQQLIPFLNNETLKWYNSAIAKMEKVTIFTALSNI